MMAKISSGMNSLSARCVPTHPPGCPAQSPRSPLAASGAAVASPAAPTATAGASAAAGSCGRWRRRMDQVGYGEDLWKKCMEAGKEFNITPYGTETMHLLRAEKGFIIVGQDTDATMTPIDLQMDWIVSKKKYDFIGKRSLYRSDTMKEDRKQLVGLLTDNPSEVLEEGAQIVADTSLKPVEMLGHVTSSYYSPNLNKSIALAVVRGGKNMLGQKLFIPMENKNINVTIVDPVFFDKENLRLNA